MLEGGRDDLFERAMALEEELGGLELDYGPTARYARTLYDAGFYRAGASAPRTTLPRGRADGDAAVNLPLYVLASIEFELGNWDRAEELATEAYDVAVQTGREAAEPRGLYTLARVESARGELESAREHAERALVMTDARGWSSGGPRGALGVLELTPRTTRPRTR